MKAARTTYCSASRSALILALTSAFYRGTADAIIRGVVDVGLTIPGLMVLITLAMNVRGGLSVPQMTLVVAALAWLFPARVIRAQVLSARERAYIDVARLSGMPTPMIIIKEVLPNLMPFIVASLVGSVSAAVLASVGLEVLGLGSFDSLTIGMTLYWVIYYAAIINSWWWWWIPPIVIIIVLFTGLFMIAVGLDEFSNPRLRRASDRSPLSHHGALQFVGQRLRVAASTASGSGPLGNVSRSASVA